jgi:hypothetical protein
VGKAVVSGHRPILQVHPKKIIIADFGVIFSSEPQSCLSLFQRFISRSLRSVELSMHSMKTAAMPTDSAKLVLEMIDCPAIPPL